MTFWEFCDKHAGALFSGGAVFGFLVVMLIDGHLINYFNTRR